MQQSLDHVFQWFAQTFQLNNPAKHPTKRAYVVPRALNAFLDRVRDYPVLRLSAALSLWCKAAQNSQGVQYHLLR